MLILDMSATTLFLLTPCMSFEIRRKTKNGCGVLEVRGLGGYTYFHGGAHVRMDRPKLDFATNLGQSTGRRVRAVS